MNRKHLQRKNHSDQTTIDGDPLIPDLCLSVLTPPIRLNFNSLRLSPIRLRQYRRQSSLREPPESRFQNMNKRFQL